MRVLDPMRPVKQWEPGIRTASQAVIGIPFAWIIAVVVGLWILYRIVRGWLALVSERPLPMSS